MILDLTFFGYGTGIVMVGWVCGFCFNIIISILKAGQRVI